MTSHVCIAIVKTLIIRQQIATHIAKNLSNKFNKNRMIYMLDKQKKKKNEKFYSLFLTTCCQL